MFRFCSYYILGVRCLRLPLKSLYREKWLAFACCLRRLHTVCCELQGRLWMPLGSSSCFLAFGVGTCKVRAGSESATLAAFKPKPYTT